MKKVLSVILCAVMVLCCFPIAVFAADSDHSFEVSANFTEPNQLTTGEYVIKENVTMTVPAGMTLYIPTGASLRVEKNAILDVQGNIRIIGGGKLYVEGTLKGGSKVICEEENSAFVSLYFISLKNANLLENIDNIAFFTSDDPAANVEFNWFDTNGNFDTNKVELVYNDAQKTGDDPVEKTVELNSYIFFKVKFKDTYPNGDPIPAKELAKVYDEGKFMLLLNDIRIPYSQGCCSVQMSAGGTVTYSQWNNDIDFYKDYKVYLPTGEGYEVLGNWGETSADGTVTLRYGTMFSFYVEIDEAYDMSNYEVYIYNGYGFTDLDVSTILKDIAPAVPNEYGYYNFEVTGETTIYVVGVVKNSTINLVGNIVDTIRNIFNMLKEFFENLFSMFK